MSKSLSSFLARLRIALQYAAPQKTLSRLAGVVTNCKKAWIAQRLIHWFINRYKVNMQEALLSDPNHYDSFNAFFTRKLADNARSLPDPSDLNTIISPADGLLSQVGYADGGTLLQAKGQTYTVSALLGGNDQLSHVFQQSAYACVYLSPKDYHRVHIPYGGVLEKMIYNPKTFTI